MTVCGWVNRRQLAAIAYLREANRVLREQLGGKRPKFTDAQRRRLAERGKALGRKALTALCSIATPDTILGWYRRLIAKKYDGSTKRPRGRPRRAQDIRELSARENPLCEARAERIRGIAEPAQAAHETRGESHVRGRGRYFDSIEACRGTRPELRPEHVPFASVLDDPLSFALDIIPVVQNSGSVLEALQASGDLVFPGCIDILLRDLVIKLLEAGEQQGAVLLRKLLGLIEELSDGRGHGH